MTFLTEAANRGSISTGYEIENSLKLERANSEKLARTPSSASNSKTWTYSFWIKRTQLGINSYHLEAKGTGDKFFIFGFNENDQIVIYDIFSDDYGKVFTRRFRDISAWYHIVLRADTTDGTASNRMRLYVNGVQETTITTDYGDFPQNHDTQINKAVVHNIGYRTDINQYASGYMAETCLIDGTSLGPDSFGEFDSDTGIWKPIDVSDLTFGTNGFYQEYKSSSALGADTVPGGNSIDYTTSNIAAADQSTDTPTNNFCTLNPLSYNVPYAATEGNTKWSKSDTTYGMASGTHYVAAGKWYWEIKATDFGTYSSCSFGIIDAYKLTVDANERGYDDPSLSANSKDILAMSGSPNNWYMNSNSTIANNGSTNSVDYTFYEGDILAFALDMDNGGYWMGCSRYSGVNNGSFWIAPGGTTTSGSVATTDPTNGNYALVGNGGGTNNGTPNFNGGTINGGSLLTAGFTFVTPLLGAYHSNTTVTLEVNFGGFTSYGETGGYSDANGYGNFAYSVPSGFYALCSKNIAEFGGT